jgi:hypothetical protein
MIGPLELALAALVLVGLMCLADWIFERFTRGD